MRRAERLLNRTVAVALVGFALLLSFRTPSDDAEGTLALFALAIVLILGGVFLWHQPSGFERRYDQARRRRW